MTATVEVLDEQIKALSAEIFELRSQIGERASERSRLLKQRAEAKYGVKPGVVVISNGKEYRVVNIDTSWGRACPWLTGNAKKKNGEWGAAVRNLYDNWELVR